MKINITHVQGRVPVTVIAPEGDVDGSNYQEVIAAGEKICAGGATALVLDLSGVGFISSAGLMAVHSITLLLRGQRPPDPEQGWQAFHTMAEDTAKSRGIKLAGAGPRVVQVLKTIGFDQRFEIYPDVGAAVASF